MKISDSHNKTQKSNFFTFFICVWARRKNKIKTYKIHSEQIRYLLFLEFPLTSKLPIYYLKQND